VGNHDACGSAELALHANAVRGNVRFAFIQGCVDDFKQLGLVDGATAQFKIDLNMFAYWSRLAQCFDVFWFGVNGGHELFDVFEVAKCLNAAGGCACTDNDE
jgi:hypothetical protein